VSIYYSRAFFGLVHHSVRLGTFNVSGKLPSQDLSSWVRGRREENALIPPLQKLSPLEVEVGTDDRHKPNDGKVYTHHLLRRV
jgi:hypothetical protein